MWGGVSLVHHAWHLPLRSPLAPPARVLPRRPHTCRRSRITASLAAAAAAAGRTPAAMVKAIVVHEFGGPEVLKWEDVELGEPKDGEIQVKNKAIGINFIDVYNRKGIYKATLPFIPGREAVGVVTAVGPGLTGRKVGDLVAYAGNPMGSYAEEQILPANVVVPVPPCIDPIVAASIMLKGMTAQFLLQRCFKVEPGHTILVHAAAGGVGSLLCQWANALGATVIGTVSSEEKAAQATEDGCHHAIIYTKEDFVARVAEITSGNGVNVVYDSVGKDTFQVSIEYGLCEVLAKQAMRVDWVPKDGKWFPDVTELEALLPPGSVDHSAEHLYPDLPRWEEPLNGARQRYQNVILALANKYPSENLLLVTHGEAVGVAVCTFLSGVEVFQVDFCAYSHLQREIIFEDSRVLTAEEFKVLTENGETGILYCPLQ